MENNVTLQSNSIKASGQSYLLRGSRFVALFEAYVLILPCYLSTQLLTLDEFAQHLKICDVYGL